MGNPKVIFRLARIAPLVLKGREVRKTTGGEPIFKRYVWDNNRQDISVEKGSVDYEFLLNHGFSRENQENKERVSEGKAPIFMFYLVDEEVNKKADIDLTKIKAKAAEQALTIWKDDEMLEVVSAMCGCILLDKDVRKSTVWKTSQDDPMKFLEIVEDPELTSKALTKMALRTGVIENKGHYIEFNKQNIANNEAELATLLSGKDDKSVNLAKGIKNLVDKKLK